MVMRWKRQIFADMRPDRHASCQAMSCLYTCNVCFDACKAQSEVLNEIQLCARCRSRRLRLWAQARTMFSAPLRAFVATPSVGWKIKHTRSLRSRVLCMGGGGWRGQHLDFQQQVRIREREQIEGRANGPISGARPCWGTQQPSRSPLLLSWSVPLLTGSDAVSGAVGTPYPAHRCPLLTVPPATPRNVMYSERISEKHDVEQWWRWWQ